MNSKNLEYIPCPYCKSPHHTKWAIELGFQAVRCNDCEIIFCNPRPILKLIDAAVKTGAHGVEAQGLNVRSRRSERKISLYRILFKALFKDLWDSKSQICWIDVGSGYGEILEAVSSLAPPGSEIIGLEPMHPKAASARSRGLKIVEDYLRPGLYTADVISVIDVFSHIPDFEAFLDDVRSSLRPNGHLFIETGNLADLERRADFPGELGLPDHLVFAGERHIVGYLNKKGFEVVCLERHPIDGFINFLKNMIKISIGRPANVALPYKSRYRQLRIRARRVK